MSPATPDPAAPPGARPPRPAASLVVVRDGSPGIEVLLLQRGVSADQNSQAWVFPGGIVEARDRECHGCCGDDDDALVSRRLGLPSNGLDFAIAAVRECFEEAGLLLVEDAQGEPPDPAWLPAWREQLQRGEPSLASLCSTGGLRLATRRLAYVAHWLTPPGMPKRFDTRFFVTVVPPGQAVRCDGAEVVDHLWLAPEAALARSVELKLMNPTRVTLRELARFESTEALMAWAHTPREVPLIMPRLGSGAQGKRPVMPAEPAWAELGHLDPQGHGQASYEIQPGVAVRLAPHLIRVTADNGSVMTGPGTNTYLLGGGDSNEWAVIDPGPRSERHLEAVLAAAPGPIRWIFATHTHTDHSPGCAPLKQRTGATVHGRLPAFPQWQDDSFVPERVLADGERIELPGGLTLRVHHTPGHASNHLCYRLEQDRLLFTGDHVMQSSTVVINPPDGDMTAYLGSLRRLLDDEPLDWLAPGHGFLMAQPRRAIEGIIAHRLRREAKVLNALRELGPSGLDALLARVYDDVKPGLHAVALRSLTAHLHKLRDEQAARESEPGVWSAAS